MNKHIIINLKCPCFLFRYPNLDIPSQALFNLHMASALPLRCGSEDNQNFQSPPGHSRQPVRRRRYCMVPVWHGALCSLHLKGREALCTEYLCTWILQSTFLYNALTSSRYYCVLYIVECKLARFLVKKIYL